MSPTHYLARAFAALLILSAGWLHAQPAPPDYWDTAPQDDDTSSARNFIPTNTGVIQDHTIHEANDEDWIVVYASATSMVLKFSSVSRPPNVELEATLFDGENMEVVTPGTFGEETYDIGYTGAGRLQLIRIRARDYSQGFDLPEPLSHLNDPITYTIESAYIIAPNTNIIGTLRSDSFILSWQDTDGSGKPIDHLTVQRYRIDRLKVEPSGSLGSWMEIGEVRPSAAPGGCRDGSYPDTYCYEDSDIRLGDTLLYQMIRVSNNGEETDLTGGDPEVVVILPTVVGFIIN